MNGGQRLEVQLYSRRRLVFPDKARGFPAEILDSDARARLDIRGALPVGPVVEPGASPSPHVGQGEDVVELKVRIPRQVADDGRDAKIRGVDLHGLAHGLLSAEDLSGQAFGQYDRRRLAQGRLGIAGQEGEGKDIEERGIDGGQLGFGKSGLAPMEVPARPPALDTGRLDDLREVPNQRFSHRGRAGRIPGLAPAGPVDAEDAKDPVAVFMEPVVAPLVADPEQDQDAANHPDGQPGDIDEGEAILAPHLAQGDLDIVPSEPGDETRRLPGRAPGAAARMGLEVFGSETVRPARRSQGFGEGVLGEIFPARSAPRPRRAGSLPARRYARPRKPDFGVKIFSTR